ncbi:Protein C2-DOMAIN ABA-RELATED 2 [Linum perenne]
MENMMGLLRIKVVRGINLAVRDVRSSDPYAIVRMDKQVLFKLYMKNRARRRGATWGRPDGTVVAGCREGIRRDELIDNLKYPNCPSVYGVWNGPNFKSWTQIRSPLTSTY